jgi:hypothetical protein
MKNHHFKWVNPLLMAIFNSYVKLPEGKSTDFYPHFLSPNLGKSWVGHWNTNQKHHVFEDSWANCDDDGSW